MSSIAIITARGGSKRIPKKNIKDFLGKPIISYSIQAAIESKMFDEVMVSTDSEEIAEMSKSYGAKVPFMRSEKTSSDFATTDDVLKEVLLNYKKLGKEFDIMCCIYPTAPFISSQKLIDAIGLLKENHADMVTPVVKFSFPPQRAFHIVSGSLEYIHPDMKNKRSQDLEPIYHDAGQFYVHNVKKFLKNDSKNIVRIPYILPEEEVQDIDNESDWKIAEMKYQLFMKKNI